jgi:hypothetical protein
LEVKLNNLWNENGVGMELHTLNMCLVLAWLPSEPDCGFKLGQTCVEFSVILFEIK